MQLRTKRREFTRNVVMGATAAAVGTLPTAQPTLGWTAQDERGASNRFPRMMQNYLIDHVRRAHRRSVESKESLTTKEEAEEYIEGVRQRIAESLGPFPEKTDLNAKTTGVVEREGYRVEKIIFESRPDFPVTANLYLPKGEHPVPGVVGTCGHSSNGKAAEPYQSFAQGLARIGYACLIYDPIGQGERFQFADAELRSRYGPGVREHLQAGNQQFLVGDFLGTWRAWDGIRALDYLLTRPEIDPEHIGVTGNSGGGTMSTWLCGVERRWTMAAPACFVTTFLRNAENELPADTEQCPPRALALGLEHEDFLVAMAPKPIVLLAKERDYFDVRGTEAAYRRLKHVYELLGKPENIALHVGPTEHGYSIENREAMYRWFNQVTKVSEATSEPDLTIEEDMTLWCTPNGQVAEMKPKTVMAFTRDKAQSQKAQRSSLEVSTLRQRIAGVLRLPINDSGNGPPASHDRLGGMQGILGYRILRDFGNRGFPRRYATTYAVETEPGIFALSYLLSDERRLSRPPQEGRRALLYVAHRSSDQELRDEAWLRGEIESRPEMPVFTCDVRGIGESLPNTCGRDSFDSPYGSDYFYAIHGLMLDRPYLGQKTWDVWQMLRWLNDLGYDRIELMAKGWGAIAATLAAVLHSESETLEQLIVREPLASFHSLAIDEDYDMPLAYLPVGLLEQFDLPECYSVLPVTRSC